MMKAARKSPLLRSFLLAATVATGFGTLWFVLTLWLGTTILEARQGKRRLYWESLVVTADGTPLIESVPRDNLSLTTYRDMNGRAHDAVERKDQLPAVYLSGEHETDALFLAQPTWPQRIKVFMDEREPAALWYFMHDDKPDGSGYFVGYERVSNRLIGYIGLSGFRANPVPPDDRIPVRGEQTLGYSNWSSAPISIYSGRDWGLRPDRWDVPPRLVHVPSGNNLRLVDLSARTVITVFEAPQPIVSVGIPTLSSFSGGEPTRRRPILVRSGQKIYRLDHEYKLISTFSIPPEVDRRSRVTWFEANDGQAVAECIAQNRGDELFDSSLTKPTVYRISEQGEVRELLELSLQNGANTPSEQAQLSLMALGLPAPAILLTAQSFMTIAGNQSQRSPAAPGTFLGQSWPALVAVVALSFVLAAMAWRRSRAFGLSKREQAVWAGFVFLFGVPAFAGYLLHRRWPVREPCPHCHSRCARDRDACAECGTPFPDPALKGTEIFA
jgi:hypothetical protein